MTKPSLGTKTIEQITENVMDYRGKTPPKSKEGIKLITAKVIKDGYILDGNHEYISEETYKLWMTRGFPQKGDILITTEAPLGEVALLRTSERVALAQRVILLRGKPNVIDPTYYLYALKTPFVQSQLLTRAASTTVLGIKQSELLQVQIPYLRLAEQKRIAAIAQKADRLRRTRRYALQLSDTYLRSVFLEMFGDPATNPQKWETGTLGDVIISAKDGPHVSPTYSDSGIPFLSTRNVRKGQIIWEDLKFISPEDVKEHWKKCKPEPGDILYTKGGTTGLAKAVDFDTEIAVWVHIAVLKLKHERVNPAWLENMLNSDFCYQQCQELTFGIVNRDLGLQRMPRIKIYIPPLPLQEKFAQIAQKFDRLRTQQREAERQAEHLFQTLLHRVFRGELTSQNADDEPESVLLEDIRAQQAKAKTEAKTATQAMGDAAEYLGTKAKQQDIEPIQLKFPGFE